MIHWWFCRLESFLMVNIEIWTNMMGIMTSIYIMGGIPFSTSQSFNHDGNINHVRGVSSKLDGDMMWTIMNRSYNEPVSEWPSCTQIWGWNLQIFPGEAVDLWCCNFGWQVSTYQIAFGLQSCWYSSNFGQKCGRVEQTRALRLKCPKSRETNCDSDHTRKRWWQSIASWESFNRETMSSVWLDERQGSALVRLGMAFSLWPIFPFLIYQSQSHAIHQKGMVNPFFSWIMIFSLIAVAQKAPCRLDKSHLAPGFPAMPEGISTIL